MRRSARPADGGEGARAAFTASAASAFGASKASRPKTVCSKASRPKASRFSLFVFGIGCLITLTLGLTACGGSSAQAEFSAIATQTSENANGAVFAADLEVYSNNINYCEQLVDSSMLQITSLDRWTAIKEDSDSAGSAEVFYVVEAADDESMPQYGAMVYPDSGFIKEARLSWDSTSALGSADVFRSYAVVQIMALSGLDADTAGKMFDTAKSSAYTNGASTQLVYAYNRSVRCYYLIGAGYHIVVTEPFSSESKTTEEATGKFVYTEVLAGGVANAGGTAATTDDTATEGTTTEDTTAADGSSDAATTDDSATASDATATDAATTTNATDGAVTTDAAAATDAAATTGAGSAETTDASDADAATGESDGESANIPVTTDGG